MTIKSKFKRKQTLHSNLSEKRALFTDIDHAGREKPGVYFPGNMFSKPSAWSLKLPWSLRKCACSQGTKTPTLSSLFNLPPLCHSAGLDMRCNTWALGDHLRCPPGPCFGILDDTKSCTQCTQSKIHFPVFCKNKRQEELTSF